MDLQTNKIGEHLHTRFVARKLSIVAKTNSTSEDCHTHAANGAAHGFAVIADQQNKGRGRERIGQTPRAWDSPPGVNLYTSVLFRFSPASPPPPALVLAAGVAVAQTVGSFTDAPITLKWPNDVLCKGKKLAGILTQVQDNTAVIGIGLNVNAMPADFANFSQIATSLAQLSGRLHDRNKVAARLYDALEKWYNALATDRALVFSKWMDYADIIGKTGQVRRPDGSTVRIHITGLDDNGFLTGTGQDGRPETIVAGDLIGWSEETDKCS
jgi:BirA family biotin operon repressor/biotin-[acetyl-CoA-carboxylase] ligase